MSSFQPQIPRMLMLLLLLVRGGVGDDYTTVDSGSCEHPVTTLEQCSAGAAAVSFSDTTAATNDYSFGADWKPPYCARVWNGGTGEYYLNFDPAGSNTGECSRVKTCVCLKTTSVSITTTSAIATTATAPSTTATASSTTLSTTTATQTSTTTTTATDTTTTTTNTATTVTITTTTVSTTTRVSSTTTTTATTATTIITTTTTPHPCNYISCAATCDGECGWSRAEGQCKFGLTTTQSMIDSKLGNCSLGSMTYAADYSWVGGVGGAIFLVCIFVCIYLTKCKQATIPGDVHAEISAFTRNDNALQTADNGMYCADDVGKSVGGHTQRASLLLATKSANQYATKSANQYADMNIPREHSYVYPTEGAARQESNKSAFTYEVPNDFSTTTAAAAAAAASPTDTQPRAVLHSIKRKRRTPPQLLLALDALKKEQADEREQLNRQVAEQAKAAEIAAAAAKSEEEAAAEEVVRRGGYGRYSGGVYEMPAEQVLFTVVNGIEVPMQLPSNANAQTKTTRPVPTLNLNLQNLTEGGDSTVAARPLHPLSTPRSPLSFASFGQEKTVLGSPSSRQASYFLASTTPRRQVSDV